MCGKNFEVCAFNKKINKNKNVFVRHFVVRVCARAHERTLLEETLVLTQHLVSFE